MKARRQLSTAKLSNAARELLVLVARTKLPLLAVGAAVVARCRELWEGLVTRGGHRADDDYFRWSYEFSWTATHVNALAAKRRRQRRMPPCVGGRHAREMTRASVVSPRDGGDEGMMMMSPGPGGEDDDGHEIDGLAEEFIHRFHEQLRMQGVGIAMQR